MKIWITGSSGSGKTTLANKIGQSLSLPVIHRDQITWKENWVQREESEQIKLIKAFSSNDQWVFDGNKFTASKQDGRYLNCDVLIHIETNRFLCFYRALSRFFKHRNNTRADLAVGCEESIDLNHLRYILVNYPRAKKWRSTFFEDLQNSRKDILILKDKVSLESWLTENKIS